MSSFNRSIVSVAAALTIAATFADADVAEFQVAKLHIYEQSTSAAPNTPVVYLLDSYVDMEDGDATLVTINGLSLSEEYPGEWTVGVEFASQGALDAAFPGFSFDLHLQGGDLGVRDEAVILTSPALYPAPAALTPASFNATQNADPSQNLLLEWSTPGANTNAVFLFIYDVANDIDIFDGEFPASQTSFLIDASMLSPGQEYEIEIAFGNVDVFSGQPASGFGAGAEGISGYAAITQINFTTTQAACEDVGRFFVVKGADFMQESDNTPPASPSAYFFGGYIDSAPGGIEFAWIDSLLSPIVTLSDPDGVGFWEDDGKGSEFISKKDLDADFPSSTTYDFHIGGGTLGMRDQSIAIGADNYPSVPYLTGTVYSDLQGMDPSQDLVIDWSPADPGVAAVFVDVYGGDEDSFSFEFPASVTSVTIPADLLTDGVEYELLINFLNATTASGDDCPGFGLGSEGLGGFISATAVFFTPQAPAACPADLTGDGIINFFDISAFLQAFNSQNPIADFTGDGIYDFFDVSAFLQAFAAGCP